MTTWETTEKFAGQPSITYNEASISYDEILYIYNGKQGTVWTKTNKN